MIREPTDDKQKKSKLRRKLTKEIGEACPPKAQRRSTPCRTDPPLSKEADGQMPDVVDMARLDYCILLQGNGLRSCCFV